MSLVKSYRNLSSKTRLGLGVGILAWGLIGLYLSDKAEDKFKPTEQDKAALDRMKPKLHVVDRREKP